MERRSSLAASAALVAAAGAAYVVARRSARRRQRVVVLGLGYCGGAVARRFAREGCQVLGTVRGAADAANSRAGVRFHQLAQGEDAALAAAVSEADVIVATAPPGEDGDPFLQQAKLKEALVACGQRGALVIYLSSVGVYGDQKGEKTDEDTKPTPRTARAKRRLAAEESWRALPLQRLMIVRLPGIYGPHRGPLAKAREGNARIMKEGHFFSRVHVGDVARTCSKLLARHCGEEGGLEGLCGGGEKAGVLNCCDSDPAPQHDVSALAYELLGRPVPPALPFDSAELSAMQRSFYEEDRYMLNERLLKVVGRLEFPSYREGLPACLAEEQRASAPSLLTSLSARARGALAALATARQPPLRVALVDNGSLKPEATLSLRRLAKSLQEAAEKRGRSVCVEAVSARWADRIPAHSLEGTAAQVLPGWLAKVAESPRGKVLLLPLLIGPSATISKSMPGAARAVPSLDVEIAPPLVCLCPVIMAQGNSGALEAAKMLADRLGEAGGPKGLAEGGQPQEGQSASGPCHVLLCDHGSPTASVAAAREAVRVELSKLLGQDVAGCCMERRDGPLYDFNGPLLEQALESLPSGARAYVALLFLQEGKHAGPGGDIAQIVAGVLERRPDLSVATTAVLAGHGGIVELLLQRMDKGVPLRLLPH